MIVNLENVRLSFPGLHDATPFKAGDDPKFKATFLVPKNSPQRKAIDAAILKVATAKWKDKAKDVLQQIKNNSNKFCWQDGDTKKYNGYAGNMALSAKSETRPKVTARDGKTILTREDGKPYAGCYVNGSIEFFAYTNSGNGISASLRWVQFFRDGEAFGGGTPVGDDEIPDLSAESIVEDGSDGMAAGDIM